ncbi:hypothetical protein Ancab_018748, partial [Ancistrocladus abbreviatus]
PCSFCPSPLKIGSIPVNRFDMNNLPGSSFGCKKYGEFASMVITPSVMESGFLIDDSSR